VHCVSLCVGKYALRTCKQEHVSKQASASCYTSSKRQQAQELPFSGSFPERKITYQCVVHCRLLLLRGRLAQSCIELPEGLFDADQEGDEELMRFALCYNLLQVRHGQGIAVQYNYKKNKKNKQTTTNPQSG